MAESKTEKKYVMKSPQSANGTSLLLVVSTLGARLLQYALRFPDGSVVDIGVPERAWFTAGPWFGRVPGATMQWLGREFHLRHPDDPATAIHGFLRRLDYECIAHGDDILILHSSFKDGIGGFHYMVPFDVVFVFRTACQGNRHFLGVELTLVNRGDVEAPFTVGFHPVDYQEIAGEYPVVHLEGLQGWYPVDDDILVPSGEFRRDVPPPGNPTAPDTFFDGMRYDGVTWFESCHLGTPGWSASVEFEKLGLVHGVEGGNNTPICQCWAPSLAPQVRGKHSTKGDVGSALEAVSGLANGVALRNAGIPHHGVTVVAPRESFVVSARFFAELNIG